MTVGVSLLDRDPKRLRMYALDFPQKKAFTHEIRGEMNFREIVGRSAALRRLLQQVETVAPTDSTVLIYGETGSGKELIARAVHDLSPRTESPFVKLNCAAIPNGSAGKRTIRPEKGAFTGAVAQLLVETC